MPHGIRLERTLCLLKDLFQYEPAMTKIVEKLKLELQESPTGRERRTAKRFSVVQRCLVRPAKSVEARVDDWRGIAFNVSATGIGLALDIPLRLGTKIIIEAWNRKNARSITARVVRASPVEFMWFLGCEIETPLTGYELEQWI